MTDIVYHDRGCKVVQLKVRSGGFINYNYIIIDHETLRAVVIDPAWEMDHLLHALKTHARSVDAVLLTHSHPDHIDLCHALAEHYACPIRMHEDEIRFSGFSARRLEAFTDLQTFFIGDTWITPVHTPGHTPGSTCFLTPESVVTGDTLFNEGCGVCHLKGGDPHQMYASLQRLLRQIPGNTRVLPAHAFHKPPGLTLSQVRENNIYLQINDPERFAAFRMQAMHRKSMAFI